MPATEKSRFAEHWISIALTTLVTFVAIIFTASILAAHFPSAGRLALLGMTILGWGLVVVGIWYVEFE